MLHRILVLLAMVFGINAQAQVIPPAQFPCTPYDAGGGGSTLRVGFAKDARVLVWSCGAMWFWIGVRGSAQIDFSGSWDRNRRTWEDLVQKHNTDPSKMEDAAIAAHALIRSITR